MASDTPPTELNSDGNDKIHMMSIRTKSWLGILIAYVILFSVTAYIAFFQEPYNPAANPSDLALNLLKEEPTREHFLKALEQEGNAFKERKELAAQSFNVVLGAVLGFLSASAVQTTTRRPGSEH